MNDTILNQQREVRALVENERRELSAELQVKFDEQILDVLMEIDALLNDRPDYQVRLVTQVRQLVRRLKAEAEAQKPAPTQTVAQAEFVEPQERWLHNPRYLENLVRAAGPEATSPIVISVVGKNHVGKSTIVALIEQLLRQKLDIAPIVTDRDGDLIHARSRVQSLDPRLVEMLRKNTFVLDEGTIPMTLLPRRPQAQG